MQEKMPDDVVGAWSDGFTSRRGWRLQEIGKTLHQYWFGRLLVEQAFEPARWIVRTC